MRRRLMDSSFSSETNASFAEIEEWSDQVAQTHYLRCFTPAALTQKFVKHTAGWTPDDAFPSPWDSTTAWATEDDRKLWTNEQFVFHASAANSVVTWQFVKFGNRQPDIDRSRVPAPTTTGGTGDTASQSGNPLGESTRGQVNETDGTIRSSGGGVTPSASS